MVYAEVEVEIEIGADRETVTVWGKVAMMFVRCRRLMVVILHHCKRISAALCEFEPMKLEDSSTCHVSIRDDCSFD